MKQYTPKSTTQTPSPDVTRSSIPPVMSSPGYRFKLLGIIGFLLLILVLLLVVHASSKRELQTLPRAPTLPHPSRKEPTAENWKKYTNNDYYISFLYPEDWIMSIESQMFEQNDLVSVRVVGPEQKYATEFYDGAVFTVAVPIATTLPLDDWLKDEDWFRGSNRQITYDMKLGHEAAILIRVCSQNCFDYQFAKHNGKIYAVVWFAGGDEEQEYRADIGRILQSFKFTTPAKMQQGWILFSNAEYGIQFEYPNLDDSCCGIDGPKTGSPTRLVTLGDASTTEEGTDNPFDGFAVFVVRNPQGLSFEEFMGKEKAELLALYKAEEENLRESAITVVGQTGVKLENYTWFGADLIYIPFPTDEKIVVFSQVEDKKGSFDVIFNQIFSTFEFTDSP